MMDRYVFPKAAQSGAELTPPVSCAPPKEKKFVIVTGEECVTRLRPSYFNDVLLAWLVYARKTYEAQAGIVDDLLEVL